MDAAQAGSQVGVVAAGPSCQPRRQAGREYPEAFIDAAAPSASSENLIYFLMRHTLLALSPPLSSRTGRREPGIRNWDLEPGRRHGHALETKIESRPRDVD